MQEFDMVIVGAGPGGYVCAIRASQLGYKTLVIEKEYLGGVCLNVGCIPSKAMITASHFYHRAGHDAAQMGIEVGPMKVDFKKLQQWKQSVCDRMAKGVGQLVAGYGGQMMMGEAQFLDPHTLQVKSSQGTQTVKAKYIVLANGSRPIEIPGFAFDEKTILSSTGALAMDSMPKRVGVIGGGYIGLEIAGFLKKFGTEVTVLEAGSAILNGVVDPECAQVVGRRYKKLGVEIITQAKAKGWKAKGKGCALEFERAGKGVETLEVDKILVTVGRRPNGDQARIKEVGVQVDERGFIKVDAQRRTTLKHIFAIGDVAGQPMLAHKASHEGVLVAEVIHGSARVYEPKTVPAVVFTDPEIASCGLMEDEARAKGYEVMVNKFPFAANGRAVSMMETEGFVKIIADKATHVVLGVHMVGPEVTNLISEATLAVEMGARLEDLALTIHPHPTLGETMMEAAEAVLGHAIHMIQKPATGAKPSTAAARPNSLRLN